MQSLDIRVASNGRMVLPLALRKAMGLHGDTKIIATFADGEVRLSPINSGVGGVGGICGHHETVARTTADFLAERAAETTHDNDER
jgi:antitoxin PrlF